MGLDFFFIIAIAIVIATKCWKVWRANTPKPEPPAPRIIRRWSAVRRWDVMQEKNLWQDAFDALDAPKVEVPNVEVPVVRAARYNSQEEIFRRLRISLESLSSPGRGSTGE